jgi:N-acyl-D-aspartate/D-glutamate deacylase
MTGRHGGADGRGIGPRVWLLVAAAAMVILAAAAVWWFTQGGDGGEVKEPGPVAEQPDDRTDEGPPGEPGGEAAEEPGEGAGGEGEAPDGTGEPAESGEAGPYDPDADVTQEELDATYDIVIANGRVINPETGLDREGLNVGITGKTIAVVTSHPLKGERVIDADGLVVAPGFIDNLSYDPNALGVWTKIADGVTTNIAMHGGTTNPKVWLAHYEREHPPVHFGASFFVMQARNSLGIGRYSAATPAQIEKLKEMAEKALNEGALGISFSLEYAPGTDSNEVLALAKIAAEYNVPVYFHGRYSDAEEPGTEIEAVEEIIGYARATGAAVHIDHINSTGGTFDMKRALQLIEEARADGLDVTACTYAYDFWGTYLNSARFDKGWQERFRIDYGDLQIAGTSERLTAETFAKYRAEGKLAVAYAIPPESVVEAFRSPYVMIGSDAILEPGNNNHPRASGNFARAIGMYVRELEVVPLIDMIDKLSTMPAKRLEKQVPALRKKGRIARGMDADIVVFDFATIIDQATVERPDLPSKGIEYVLVEGQVVLENGVVNKKVRPGHGIRSEFVRVSEQAGTLAWDGAEYPLVAFRDERVVDLAALAKHGFGLTWDGVARLYTVTAGGSAVDGPAADSRPEAMPEKGALMLERGYRAAGPGGAETELISIGGRVFAPLNFLGDLGLRVSDEGDVITVER